MLRWDFVVLWLVASGREGADHEKVYTSDEDILLRKS